MVPVKAGKRLVGLQFIQNDGSKKFLTGTPKRGAFHMVGAVDADVPVLAVAEGYATAATVHEVTGWPVAVAFDAGNLEPVARAMRKARPSARVAIAADNDHRTEGNPGISKARAAAQAVDGAVIAPKFAPEETGTDWNDYAATHGRDATRAALVAGLDAEAAQAPPVDTPATAQPPLSKRDSKAKGRGTRDAGPLRSGYELRDDGLYWCEVEYREGEARARPPMFLASPLRIEAVTRDMRGRKHGRLLTFTDIDGNPKTWNMPARLLAGGRGDELRAALLEEGLPAISLEPNAQRRLLMYLMREIPAARARSVSQIGWHGPAFVLAGHVYGNAGGERFFLNSDLEGISPFTQVGDLSSWRTSLAIPCGHHRRAVFALSAAFAGPLVELAGAESGGFHLVSKSSIGKTTALRLAASVWGGPETFCRNWRATSNGLEAIAEDFNDCLLCLDEIKQAESATIGEVAYMLANGRGKVRARQEGGSRPIKSFRVLLLSTGEVGSAAMLNEAGKRSYAGHDVRLVEIPADSGRGFGLFDSSGDFADARGLADHLVDAARVTHGYAGPAFLAKLVEQREAVAVEARNRIASFVENVTPAGSDPQVLRVAARFGLVTFAGELATRWGLTGWRSDVVEVATLDAFDAWLDRRGTHGAKEPEQMLGQVRAFIEAHGGARYQDLGTRGPGTHDDGDDVERRIINRAGYRRKAIDTGRTIYYTAPEVFRLEVCAGFDHRDVLRVLADQGVLIGANTKEKRYTSKVRTPQSDKPMNFYAIDGDALFAGDAH